MHTASQNAETTNPAMRRCVLSQDNVECSILALAPGEQINCDDTHWTEEHLLFVVDGSVTVQTDDVTMFLKKDAAMLIAPDKHAVITGDRTSWTKLVRIDFTHRTVVEPVITFPGRESSASSR